MGMENKKKIIKLTDYAASLGRELTIKSLQSIDASADVVGKEFTHDLTLTFLTHFIGAAVYRVLTEKREGTRKEIGIQVKDDFATFKYATQDAIALAFQAAVSNYSKVNIDYYCKITPEPEFKTKMPC